jgi:hypothetical protein
MPARRSAAPAAAGSRAACGSARRTAIDEARHPPSDPGDGRGAADFRPEGAITAAGSGGAQGGNCRSGAASRASGGGAAGSVHRGRPLPAGRSGAVPGSAEARSGRLRPAHGRAHWAVPHRHRARRGRAGRRAVLLELRHRDRLQPRRPALLPAGPAQQVARHQRATSSAACPASRSSTSPIPR